MKATVHNNAVAAAIDELRSRGKTEFTTIDVFAVYKRLSPRKCWRDAKAVGTSLRKHALRLGIEAGGEKKWVSTGAFSSEVIIWRVRSRDST